MLEDVKDIIILDDLVIEFGDFRVAASDTMHVEHILRLDLGQARQFPLIGVGLLRVVNASVNRQALKQNVRRNLVYDNYSVESINLFDDLTIEPNCTRLK